MLIIFFVVWSHRDAALVSYALYIHYAFMEITRRRFAAVVFCIVQWNRQIQMFRPFCRGAECRNGIFKLLCVLIKFDAIKLNLAIHDDDWWIINCWYESGSYDVFIVVQVQFLSTEYRKYTAILVEFYSRRLMLRYWVNQRQRPYLRIGRDNEISK